MTPQREAVLAAVRRRHDHPTAAEIFEETRAAMPSISQATVYNSLRFLVQIGLVREITFGNGASRFDRETSRHDHAICTHCGALVDFDLPLAPELARAAARRSGFQLESLEMTLRGACSECRLLARR